LKSHNAGAARRLAAMEPSPTWHVASLGNLNGANMRRRRWILYTLLAAVAPADGLSASKAQSGAGSPPLGQPGKANAGNEQPGEAGQPSSFSTAGGAGGAGGRGGNDGASGSGASPDQPGQSGPKGSTGSNNSEDAAIPKRTAPPL